MQKKKNSNKKSSLAQDILSSSGANMVPFLGVISDDNLP